jgi:hypothetical protein
MNKTMKAKSVIFWTTTALTAASMAAASALYLSRNRKMMQKFQSLDYPEYFRNMLGASKLLDAAALVTPGSKVVKEWAYAGFTFTFLSAFVSHLARKQIKEPGAPLASLVMLAVSYFTRPRRERPL